MFDLDRRALILIPAALGFSALPRPAAAQEAGLTEILAAALEAIDKFGIESPAHFRQFFEALWTVRAGMSRARIEPGAFDELAGLLKQASDRMAQDGAEAATRGAEVKENTIRYQNALFASATALNRDGKGQVVVRPGLIGSIADFLCPLYPFC